MPYTENLKKALALKEELDRFRPLSPEMEQRILQKFRLDWNYHSSHIEGNLLTYGETRALILFGQTAQAKPLKDHLEMTGHDEAIKYIEEVIRQERPLTEAFIRELHQIILKSPYTVDAITPDGQPTQKSIKIGQYKTTPNHVKTVTGEIFYFASPEETPAKMADLLQWYHEQVNDPENNPILFATEFHYRFIRIHPFDDGNGRIARLLMNFILMQKGYPPAIIKTEEKKKYFTALQQADAGQLEYFFSYMCIQVIHSLELMVKAAKGESIEEPDDIDKEIAVWKNQLKGKQANVIPKSDSQVYELWEHGIRSLFEYYVEKMKPFEDMFATKVIVGWVNNMKDEKYNLGVNFIDLSFKAWENGQAWFLNPGEAPPDKADESFENIRIEIKLKGFKQDGTNTFDIVNELRVDFFEFQYHIGFNSEMLTEALYSDFPDGEKIQKLINPCIKKTLEQIKSRMKN